MTLDKKVSLMEFVRLPVHEDDDADFVRYGWEQAGSRWADVVETGKQNNYSKQGIGAKTAVFTVGKGGRITEKNAIRWKDGWYFITDIREAGPVSLEVITAAVTLQPFVALRSNEEPDEFKRPIYDPVPFAAFPAVLTEKYLRYAQEEPMARTTAVLVLVTPKEVVLNAGNLVVKENDSSKKKQHYVVQACHLLGEHRNEYEICREEDV